MKPGESRGCRLARLSSINSQLSLSLCLEDLDSPGVSSCLAWIKFDQGWETKPGQEVSDSTAGLKDGKTLFSEQPSFQATFLASLPC